jgi:hypothetical protein
MRKLAITVIIGLLLIGVNAYAAGDLVVNGQLGAGVSNPQYRLAVQGDVADGLYIMNTDGNVAAFFNTNAAKAGRFGLFDETGLELVKFVAGGVGTFEATTVTFKDLNGVDILTVGHDDAPIKFEGDPGLSTTITVGDGSGGSCTITFKAGGATGTTCPQL